MSSSRAYQGLIVFEKKGKPCLFWRPVRSTLPSVFAVESTSGKVFQKTATAVSFFDTDGKKIALSETPFLRASTVGTKSILSFVGNKKEVSFAALKGTSSWQVVATPDLFRGPTVVVKVPAHAGKKSKYIAFSSRNRRAIFQGRSTDSLDDFRDFGDVVEARRKHFDATDLSPLVAMMVPQGILLVYAAKNAVGRLTVGAVVFDRDRPKVVLWRSEEALFEMSGRSSSDTVLLGGVNIGKYFYLYVQGPRKEVEYFPIARYWETVGKQVRHDFVLPPRKKGAVIVLDRPTSNPVLKPIARHSWEAFATFNPAAIVLDDRIHLLYRAQGYDGLSVLGYAASTDGIHIDERHSEPVFVPSQAGRGKDGDKGYTNVSGGGTGGCEDPRLVEIDGTIYLIYVSFDGVHPPGVALSYISKKDFAAKRFRFSRPKLISRPGQIQKNWVLFPKKIGGKYAVLHGISPKIRIEYIDDPKALGDGKFIESLSSHGGGGYVEATRLRAWDNIVRGAGAPPLWTPHGWLVFYHGMDMRDPGKYKVGVMLLDLEHPENVLRRSLEPVLEPETEYENGGHKKGVIYVCGAVIKDGRLFVYYGAADCTSAVAVADAETFLQSLLKEEAPVLKKMNP